MRTINLESLAIFKTVVEERGVVRAAEKLHRVPSNVTTRVRQLEKYLEVRLFKKEGRTLILSADFSTNSANGSYQRYTGRSTRKSSRTG